MIWNRYSHIIFTASYLRYKHDATFFAVDVTCSSLTLRSYVNVIWKDFLVRSNLIINMVENNFGSNENKKVTFVFRHLSIRTTVIRVIDCFGFDLFVSVPVTFSSFSLSSYFVSFRFSIFLFSLPARMDCLDDAKQLSMRHAMKPSLPRQRLPLRRVSS